MLARYATCRALAALRKLIVFLILAPFACGSHAAKDTPFGVELIPANSPSSTIDETFQALAVTAVIGSHSSFIWHWDDRNALNGVTALVPLMRQYGLKSFLQLGSTFLGNPAPPQGFSKSFADAQVRALYLADVNTLASLQPDYMVLTTEINLMHRFNRVEFENYQGLYREAYDLVKRISPNTKVGVSYLYSLWFANYVIDKLDVPALIAPADFVAFSSYPEWLVREGHFASIADIPPDWYGTSRTAYPNTPIIFSEIGWASKVRGTPEVQAEFLRNLPRLMSTTKPELITWAVLHDIEFFQRSLLSPEATQFLVSLGVDIDALFGHFNGMGLLDGFGNPKPGLLDASQLVFPKP